MMESTVRVVEPKQRSIYPCLKISKSGTVAMFISATGGIVVSPGKYPEPKIGYLNLNWSDAGWAKFAGLVTLKNTL
jgi:hypothetical protein